MLSLSGGPQSLPTTPHHPRETKFVCDAVTACPHNSAPFEHGTTAALQVKGVRNSAEGLGIPQKPNWERLTRHGLALIAEDIKLRLHRPMCTENENQRKFFSAAREMSCFHSLCTCTEKDHQRKLLRSEKRCRERPTITLMLDLPHREREDGPRPPPRQHRALRTRVKGIIRSSLSARSQRNTANKRGMDRPMLCDHRARGSSR